MTGCGLGTAAPASLEPTTVARFGGTLFGGPTPIAGATVKLYATTSPSAGTGTPTSVYGQGVFLQEANTAAGMSSGQDTNQYGTFSFAGGVSCPGGEFAYLVASGGNTGAGTNTASVLVAALGRCEDLFSGTTYTGNSIFMNEITTVAAAYALGNFATTSGSSNATVVGIGADANNNAVTGSTTQAAGLRHAFQNAANLVNVFANSGIGSPDGAYLNPPADTYAIVPQAEINALANSLVACVNSAGPSSPACATILGATTLAGGTAPTNTFQAMVNLAANPSLAGATTNPNTSAAFTPADIFNAASSTTSVYAPALTVAPNDWSISIHYPASTYGTSTQGLLNPASGALDMNDNLYVGNQNNLGSTASASNPSTASNMVGFGSNGTLLGISPNVTTTVSGLGVSTDALGNAYQLGSTATASSGATTTLYRFAVNGGAPGTSTAIAIATGTGTNGGVPLASAVDRANNVWYSSTLAGGASNRTVWKVNSGATVANFQFQSQASQPSYGIAVDPNQNIWVSNYNTPSVSVLQNTAASASVTPTYAPVTTTTPNTPNVDQVLNTSGATSSGTSLFGIAFGATASGGSSGSYIAYAISNLQAGSTQQGAAPLTPAFASTGSPLAVTSFTQGTQIVSTTAAPINNPRYAATDGSGAIWLADTGGSRIHYFSPYVATARQSANLTPCLVVVSGSSYVCSNSSTQATPTMAFIAPRYVVPDSSGSLWVVSIGSAAGGGSVDQIIGAAAPSWPLLSLGLSNTQP